jgi:signal peptidase I
VKRVIGLPGEYVTLESGIVSVDETRLHEPYLEPVAGDARHDAGAWLLDENEYFALGDSRAISIDSRRFGPVNGHAIVGACLWRVWPLRRWGRLPRQ